MSTFLPNTYSDVTQSNGLLNTTSKMIERLVSVYRYAPQKSIWQGLYCTLAVPLFSATGKSTYQNWLLELSQISQMAKTTKGNR